MAKQQKFYVVWEGYTPGIYTSWDACQQQIKGFPKAKYKSFATREQAAEAFAGNYDDFKGKTVEKKPLSPEEKAKFGSPIPLSICVDGAGSGKTKRIEYQGVITETGTQIFHAGPFEDGTNNIAEFLAIVHALAYCQKNGLDYTIYSDSRTAMSWVKKRTVRTTLTPSDKNTKLRVLVQRALNWLNNNSYPNKILKWETKAWGENPADFGRK